MHSCSKTNNHNILMAMNLPSEQHRCGSSNTYLQIKETYVEWLAIWRFYSSNSTLKLELIAYVYVKNRTIFHKRKERKKIKAH